MSPPRRLALMILIVLLAGAGAAPALAGEYSVHACDPAVADINHSWTASANHGGMVAYANCPAATVGPAWNLGLVTRYVPVPNGTVPQGAYSALTLQAPPGASLSRIAVTHTFCAWAGFRTGLMNAAGVWIRSLGTATCGSFDPAQFGFSLGGTSQVRLVTQCIKGPCNVGSPNLVAWASLRSATVWIADGTPASFGDHGRVGRDAGVEERPCRPRSQRIRQRWDSVCRCGGRRRDPQRAETAV